MKNFLIELFKLVVAALVIILVIVAAFVYVDKVDQTQSRQLNSDTVRTWLNDLEVEKEELFKARTLKELCSSKNETEEAWCVGYMLGFVEGHEISPKFFCPDGALGTVDQTIQSFRNFMEDNPQHWEKSRRAVLGAALQDTFPCD